MKEGVLLYLTQAERYREGQLRAFIERNGLSEVPVVVAGQGEGTLNFYEAYRELGVKGVDIVECFSARINEEGELELLKSNITLPVGIDLLKFCRPEELGLAGEMGSKTTESF